MATGHRSLSGPKCGGHSVAGHAGGGQSLRYLSRFAGQADHLWRQDRAFRQRTAWTEPAGRRHGGQPDTGQQSGGSGLPARQAGQPQARENCPRGAAARTHADHGRNAGGSWRLRTFEAGVGSGLAARRRCQRPGRWTPGRVP